jgi:hypothetical protein
LHILSEISALVFSLHEVSMTLFFMYQLWVCVHVSVYMWHRDREMRERTEKNSQFCFLH